MMKLKLPLALAAISLSCATMHAQQQPLEQPLTNWPSQDGQNFQVGQLACPLSVQGLNIHDSSGNVTASIPLLTDPASVGATTQIGDTLYALIPPDGNNQATALVMYQPDNSADPSTSDEVNKAIQDALNHNNWFNATYVIRNMSASDQPLPAGTQFWVCSSTGFVTLTDNGSICVAGPPAPTVDPSDPAITGLASLITGGQ
jgi:hypothetical protein